MEDALYLFNIGQNYKSYKILGSHYENRDGVDGFRFAVWAPNAQYVGLAGDFNQWQHESNPLERIASTGVWQTFIPNATENQCYKYYIVGADGLSRYKADPFARKSELRPNDASVLLIDTEYDWTDAEYLQNREQREKQNTLFSPINIYEVHLPSWRTKEDGSPYSLREIAQPLGDYLEEMGYTHVEIMPITEYPFDGSWGYQVTGYFSVTARLGEKKDFQYFVDYLHSRNIGVILDWVPAHFPRDAFGLAYFDGSPCYEYSDTRLGEHADWGTLVFDYSRAEVQSFLSSSAMYWIEECHIDGIRVDAVSAMIYRNYGRDEYLPNQDGGTENYEATEFLKNLNNLVHEQYPGVLMIAEESTSWPKITHPTSEGGLGFDMKWDMGWMHDTLEYFSLDYLYREHHHSKITFSMIYNFHERFLLAISHDEVVHGKASLISKMPGDFWRQFASMREFFVYMMGHPGGKLSFMGSEFGQFIEWRYYEQLEWFLLDYEMHKKLHNFVKKLNHLYLDIPAFWEDDKSWEGFNWLNADDSVNSVYSWMRRDKQGKILVFIMNMVPQPIERYKFPVPKHGSYRLLMNSDAAHWGGSNFPVVVPKGEERIHEDNVVFGEEIYSWEEDEEREVQDREQEPHAEGILFHSRKIRFQNFEQSMRVNLPPLAALVFELEEEDPSLEGKSWPDPELPYPGDWNT